jgi:hypothetical protein
MLAYMPASYACKDIIACGDATEGDYNLLLKVRDPSRTGFQVLVIIPEDYRYVYHHPWSGKKLTIITDHKYIGVTSLNDIPPFIVKSGMVLTDAGLAYGDADTDSGWVNPSKNAWDDFDWIRYSCEKADNTDEAVKLLTEEAVDELHATGVSENLLIVGPDKGVFIEADAFRYDVKEIVNGVDVVQNYPRELWRTQKLKTRLISSSFDNEKEKSVLKGMTVKLNGLLGIRIVDITENSIFVKQVPFFSYFYYENGKIHFIRDPKEIIIDERKTIGDFSVTLKEINGNRATIKLTTKAKAWEDTMLDYINERYGSITVKDMITWSRFRSTELGDLRAMCEPNVIYEGSAVYKIPEENYEILSGGWFSTNLASSSIYVPFHICDTEIFDPYESGGAAVLSRELFKFYNNSLIPIIESCEDVFLFENDVVESFVMNSLSNEEIISEVITISDVFIQKQAWATQQMFDEIKSFSNDELRLKYLEILNDTWKNNYSMTLNQMKNNVLLFDKMKGSSSINDLYHSIPLFIIESQINICQALEISCEQSVNDFKQGKQLLQSGNYEEGFNYLIKSYDLTQQILNDEEMDFNNQLSNVKDTSIFSSFIFIGFILLILFSSVSIVIKKILKKK